MQPYLEMPTQRLQSEKARELKELSRRSSKLTALRDSISNTLHKKKY